MTSDQILLRNNQIVANAQQGAMTQVPWDKQTIAYDANANPITLQYYMNGIQVGKVSITYNANNDPTIIEKVSF
jgi:hypothetical protein